MLSRHAAPRHVRPFVSVLVEVAHGAGEEAREAALLAGAAKVRAGWGVGR